MREVHLTTWLIPSLLLLMTACNQAYINLNSFKPVNSVVSSRISVALNNSNYPLQLNFTGLKNSDRIYLLQNSDQNCEGGKNIGFDFVDSNLGYMTSTFSKADLNSTVRVLVYNDSERICSGPISFNLNVSLDPYQAPGQLPVLSFNETSRVPLGTVSPARALPQPAYDYLLGVVTIPQLRPVMANGGAHGCAIQIDSTVQCWGWNNYGQLGDGSSVTYSSTPVEVPGIANAVALGTGYYHSCVVTSDGKAYCWGAGWGGQLGSGSSDSSVPLEIPGITDAISVSGGFQHSCVLRRTGEVTCYGNVSGMGITDAVGVSSGHSHVCILRGDGTVACGGGSFSSNTTSITTAVGIYSGFNHACALLSDGNAKCWGTNSEGQLGPGGDTTTPIDIPGFSNVVNMSLGSGTSCALLSSGKIYCIGKGNFGELGNGFYSNSSTALEVTGVNNATFLSLGMIHGCAILDNNRVKCWGMSSSGRIPTDTYNPNVPVDTLLPSGEKILGSVTSTVAPKKMSLGERHGCLIHADQSVSCWGDGKYGQLGRGSDLSSAVAVSVTGLSSVIGISSGNNHSCALRSNGQVFCWGAGDAGQLGQGTFTSSSLPIQVSLSANATGVSTFGDSSCANLVTGFIECWGAAGSGQLGNGSTTYTATPVRVAGITNSMKVTLGNGFACSILSEGNMKCWGAGWDGNLGHGQNGNSMKPVEVSNINNAVDMSLGQNHTCALLATGEVYCWGSGTLGNLGNGFSVSQNIPVKVANITNAVGISTGTSFSCALLDSGKSYCWGYGANGRLGNRNTSNTPYATEVLGISNIEEISSYNNRSCARESNGHIMCWGENLDLPASLSMTNLKGVRDYSVITNQSACFVLDDKRVQCIGYLQFLGVVIPDSGTFHSLEETTPISGLTNVSTLTSTSQSHCALTESGDVYCWGPNGYGQVGMADYVPHPEINQIVINGAEKAIQLISHSDSNCALTDAKKVYCWGGWEYPAQPTELSGLGQINKIFLSSESMCVRDDDEKVYCKGQNYDGELGIDPNSMAYISSFTEIPEFAGALDLKFFTSFSCGIFGTNRELKCVGSNAYGQLGVDSSTTSSFTLVAPGIQNVDYLIRDTKSYRRLYFVQNGKTHFIGGGDHLVRDVKMGNAAKLIQNPSSGSFYGIMGTERYFVVLSDPLIADSVDFILQTTPDYNPVRLK